MDTTCNKCTRNNLECSDKGTIRLRYQRTSKHDSYYMKIGKNTMKSPGDLRNLAITQTPVKDHQLTLTLKKSQRVIKRRRKKELETLIHTVGI